MLATIATFVSALLIVVLIHEAGHYMAMRKLGVEIEAVGVGLPFGPALSFRRKPTTKRPNPLEVNVHLALLGAYVQPSKTGTAQLLALGYRDQTWVYNVGVIAGQLTAMVFLTASAFLRGQPGRAAVAIAVGSVVWTFRRPLAAYVLPTVGAVASAIVVVRGLFELFRTDDGVTQLGMVGLASASDEVMAAYDSPIAAYLSLLAVLSLAIATVNLLPLFGLDNGRSVELLLHRVGMSATGRNWFRRFGNAALIALLAAAVGSDLLNLLPN